jgi:hypothetical protein
MRIILMLLCFPFLLQAQNNSIAEKTKTMELHKGYFNYYWDAAQGKIFLAVDKLETPFLYVNSLPAGLGSNDIGLDRGQIGDSRIVFFQRVGKNYYSLNLIPTIVLLPVIPENKKQSMNLSRNLSYLVLMLKQKKPIPF